MNHPLFRTRRALSLFLVLGASLLLVACPPAPSDDDDDDDSTQAGGPPCLLVCLVQSGVCPTLTGAPGYAEARASCDSQCTADPMAYTMNQSDYDLEYTRVCSDPGDDDDDSSPGDDDDDDSAGPGGSMLSGAAVSLNFVDVDGLALCTRTFDATGAVTWGSEAVPGLSFGSGRIDFTMGTTMLEDTCAGGVPDTHDPTLSAGFDTLLSIGLIPAAAVEANSLQLQAGQAIGDIFASYATNSPPLTASHAGYVQSELLAPGTGPTMIGSWAPAWALLLADGNTYSGDEMLGAYLGATFWRWNFTEPDVSGIAGFTLVVQFSVL